MNSSEIKRAIELRKQEKKIAEKTARAIASMQKKIDLKRNYEENYLKELQNIKLDHDLRNQKYRDSLQRFSQQFQDDLMVLGQSKTTLENERRKLTQHLEITFPLLAKGIQKRKIQQKKNQNERIQNENRKTLDEYRKQEELKRITLQRHQKEEEIRRLNIQAEKEANLVIQQQNIATSKQQYIEFQSEINKKISKLDEERENIEIAEENQGENFQQEEQLEFGKNEEVKITNSDPYIQYSNKLNTVGMYGESSELAQGQFTGSNSKKKNVLEHIAEVKGYDQDDDLGMNVAGLGNEGDDNYDNSFDDI